MTEEEKKEFEEFLQWKAERAKKKEMEDLHLTGKDDNASSVTSDTPSLTSKMENKSSDFQKNSNKNMGWVITIAIVAILNLFLLVNILSNKHSQQTTTEVKDSVAIIDDENIVKPIYDAKQDSISQAERINKVKNTIKIKSAYLSRPNSASGVDAFFYYKNVSNKTIKYLVWTGYPMNAVGDRVSCEIRGYRDYRGKDTGPIKPGRSSGGCWDCAWYNSTAKKLIITRIEIEYMDGTKFTIKENEIEFVR